MKHLHAYSLALLSQTGHFSCVKAGEDLLFVSHDQINRCLHRGGFQAFAEMELLPEGGDVIVDDTLIAKPYCKQIEGVGYFYDSKEKKSLPGLNCLLILYVKDKEVFVLDVIIKEKGGKTKNDLVRESFIRLYELGLKPFVVLFDIWYAAYKTLNLLDGLGWRYLSQVRENRLLEGMPVKKHRFYGANSRYGYLKGVHHRVQVVKNGDRYFVTNDVEPFSSVLAAKLYQRRWTIETVFRDLKDQLHLEKCAARSLNAQYNHILACFEAYFFLKSQFPDMSLQKAHRQISRQLIRETANQERFLAMAA
jgi:hypothetical protein